MNAYVQNLLVFLIIMILVLVGDAKGVDQRVYDVWKTYEGDPNNFQLKLFRAYWNIRGIQAGIVRSLEMLDCLPELIVAFWDGESKGTKFVMDTVLRRHFNLKVVFDI